MAQTQTRRESSEAIRELWGRYRASGDPRLRDRLVLSLAPMVKYIVYRKVREIPARCEVEDFISAGLEALIRSIDRYDPEGGATLEQFAWTRIQGAVLDELRSGDWAPRSLRRRERDLARAKASFHELYGRAPSRVELAAAVGIDPAELSRRLDDINRAEIGSLNVLVHGQEDASVERIDTLRSSDRDTDPEACAMREGALRRFRRAFDKLPSRDRHVAVLLYVERLSLREIGEVLGVSESRVCQIHRGLRQTLRGLLAADELLLAEVA